MEKGIEIEFKKIPCKKCGAYAGFAVKCKHMDKYKLYCTSCGSYIRFAKTEEKVLINARSAWLKEHNE